MADGTNGFDVSTAPQSLTPTSQEKLKQFVARIEKLGDE